MNVGYVIGKAALKEIFPSGVPELSEEYIRNRTRVYDPVEKKEEYLFDVLPEMWEIWIGMENLSKMINEDHVRWATALMTKITREGRFNPNKPPTNEEMTQLDPHKDWKNHGHSVIHQEYDVLRETFWLMVREHLDGMETKPVEHVPTELGVRMKGDIPIVVSYPPETSPLDILRGKLGGLLGI